MLQHQLMFQYSKLLLASTSKMRNTKKQFFHLTSTPVGKHNEVYSTSAPFPDQEILLVLPSHCKSAIPSW